MQGMTEAIWAAALAMLVQWSGAHAAAAQPAFETKKVDGTDNVYIYRHGNHEAMFVVTTAGVIATDPVGYGHPEAVETYLAEITQGDRQAGQVSRL